MSMEQLQRDMDFLSVFTNRFTNAAICPVAKEIPEEIRKQLDEYLFQLEACCKFSDCRHETEPGCAIRAAIANGSLAQDRYELYRSLHEESRHAAKMKDISKWRKQLKKRR